MSGSAPSPDLSILGEQPDHLREASAVAAERIQKQQERKPEDQAAKAEADNPKGQESYTFTFKHRDARGKLWKGTFTNKMPTVAARQLIALLQSDWQAGRPWESIDPSILTINEMIAHMQYTLKPSEDAAWARDSDGRLEIRNLHDHGVIQALWAEVSSHEAIFLGHGAPEEGSKKDG